MPQLWRILVRSLLYLCLARVFAATRTRCQQLLQALGLQDAGRMQRMQRIQLAMGQQEIRTTACLQSTLLVANSGCWA